MFTAIRILTSRAATTSRPYREKEIREVRILIFPLFPATSRQGIGEVPRGWRGSEHE